MPSKYPMSLVCDTSVIVEERRRRRYLQWLHVLGYFTQDKYGHMYETEIKKEKPQLRYHTELWEQNTKFIFYLFLRELPAELHILKRYCAHQTFCTAHFPVRTRSSFTLMQNVPWSDIVLST